MEFRSSLASRSKLLPRIPSKGLMIQITSMVLTSMKASTNEGALVKGVIKSHKEIKGRIRSRMWNVGRRIDDSRWPLRYPQHREVSNLRSTRGPSINTAEFKKPVRVFGSP